jgi:biotin carboxylase
MNDTPPGAVNVLILAPVSRHVTEEFIQACRDNGWASILVRTVSAGSPDDLDVQPDELVVIESLGMALDALAERIAPYRPAAIVPGGELAVPMADRLAARLGLVHNPLHRLAAYREKDTMRAAFAAAGVPQPARYASFTSPEAAGDFDWSTVDFPVIAKPVDGSASYFTTRCDTVEEVLEAVPRIIGHAHSRATGLDFARRAMVEAFVDGPEFSADCVVGDGRPRLVSARQKFVSPRPHCDITAHLVADVVPAWATEELAGVTERIISAFEVSDTVMHIEFKLDPPTRSLRILEVGNRMAGDYVSQAVRLVNGWGLAEALVRLRAGMPHDPARRPERAGPLAAYGVKFLFADQPAPAPPEVTVISRGPADDFASDEDHGPFHVTRRRAYEIVGSDDLRALRDHLARL